MKTNIVLIGMPGSGKSTLAKMLSQHLGLELIDLDDEIERQSGKKISQLFEKGEAHFRAVETAVTKAVAQKNHAIISTGGGVILKTENMEALKENGVIIFLNRSLEQIANDVEVGNRPLLAEGTHKLRKLHDERIHLYKKYAEITIKNNETTAIAIEQLLEQLPESFKKGLSHEI
ncbi:shikimate kinase [Jeotgalibaca sp. A127]|uniref:shikimate kinase n=1 Tax=Jeotgalibaca sp. A127 TaxID=3457324 RepID=UPI003FD55DCE